jgi:glyoxylase-like metal-dependent hydrolase (beta-lactamase superfamily II)
MRSKKGGPMEYFRGDPKPEVVKEFKHSRIDEVGPDFWRLEGYSGHPFSEKQSCSNHYVVRDRDTVVVFDSGIYLHYRERLLNKIREYEVKGMKRFILLNSHGHIDHVANNDIILEVDFPEVRFLLPEPELQVLDWNRYLLNDLKEIEEYYDPKTIGEAFVKPYESGLSLATMADRAEPLSLNSRVKHKYGDVELEGWELGRLFVIHDGSHSPGHCCLYDPENKILAVGDLTLEVNPPSMDASLDGCIEVARKFRRLAEQGYVETVVDSHRASSFLPAVYEGINVEPFSEILMKPWARGRDECVESFRVWSEDYYTTLKEQVLAAHSRLGEATVGEIIEELKKSTNQMIMSKIAFSFPNRPSRLGVWVSVVLKESGAQRRKVGEQTIFTTPKS